MNHEEAKNTKKILSGSRKQPARVKDQRYPLSGAVKAEKPCSQPVPNLDDWLEIGRIVAPQGLNGELRVYPDTDFPERFEKPGRRWLLGSGETELQPVELLHGRYIEGKNLYVIRLKGVSDRSQAENMRDGRFFVPVSDRPKLAAGEFHVIDLLGLQVFMQSSGELVGTLVDILPSGHDLLEVKLDAAFAEDKAGKTVLIPFVMEIVPVVDLENRRVEITPPPGLLSIND